MTCGNGQKHALTRDDATCQRSSTRVISQQNASYARPGTRCDEGPRTRTQPFIRTVRADVGNPHADVPIGDTPRNASCGAEFADLIGGSDGTEERERRFDHATVEPILAATGGVNRE